MRNLLKAILAITLILGQIMTAQLVMTAPAAASSTDLFDDATTNIFPDFGNIDDLAAELWGTPAVRENVVAGVLIAGTVVLAVVGAPAAIAAGTVATVAALASIPAATIGTTAVAIGAGLWIGGLAIYDDAKERAAAEKVKMENKRKLQQAETLQREQYAYSAASRDRDSGRERAVQRQNADMMRSAMEIEAQGARVAASEGYAEIFSGSDGNGALTYSGTRSGGQVRGDYVSREEGQSYTGVFSGSIQRNGSVSGTYVEGNEIGNFSGQASPDLSKIFSGGAKCESGCN